MQHDGAVVVLEWISQENSTFQEESGAETMEIGGGGVKGGNLKGV